MSQPCGARQEKAQETNWVIEQGTPSFLPTFTTVWIKWRINLPWQLGAKATQRDPLLGCEICCPKVQFQNVSSEWLLGFSQEGRDIAVVEGV